uniref:Uncharacterized protein n=1 Tax=Anopheles maculatus TaxID=74869 RepID=A0A182S5R5_9DIPT
MSGACDLDAQPELFAREKVKVVAVMGRHPERFLVDDGVHVADAHLVRSPIVGVLTGPVAYGQQDRQLFLHVAHLHEQCQVDDILLRPVVTDLIHIEVLLELAGRGGVMLTVFAH